jgi:hypothetical protein
MSIRITIIPALIAAAILGACDKGADPAPVEPKAALTSAWQSTAHTMWPGVKSKPTDKPETDYVKASGGCNPLPEITFQSNGHFWMAGGVSRCPGFEGGSDTGIWTLSEDGKTLTLDSDKSASNRKVWTVKSLTAKALTVEYPFQGSLGDGTPQTEILTFRPK